MGFMEKLDELLPVEKATELFVEGCKDRNKGTAHRYLETYFKMKGIEDGLSKDFVIQFGDISEVNPLEWQDIVGNIDESDYRSRVDELLGKNREEVE